MSYLYHFKLFFEKFRFCLGGRCTYEYPNGVSFPSTVKPKLVKTSSTTETNLVSTQVVKTFAQHSRGPGFESPRGRSYSKPSTPPASAIERLESKVENMLSNQETILSNQKEILSNQENFEKRLDEMERKKGFDIYISKNIFRGFFLVILTQWNFKSYAF